MLSNQHFYHRIIRRLVIAFGSLFNNIKLYRYTKDGSIEIERITVPLSYATKEKFYTRITQDPTLGKELAITLPRMSFELSSIAYDPIRKMSSFNNLISPGASGTTLSTTPFTPYNFNFDLYIYVRNVEDGTQIVEQILPYFAPDYTVTADISTLVDIKTDIPIVLNSINYDQNAIGEADQLRTLIWNLNFTVKGYLYGPVENKGIVNKVTANVFNDQFSTTNEYDITLGAGSGEFKIGELVFQGRKPVDANSTAFVSSWDSNANVLIVTDKTGVIEVGKYITGAVTNASYNVASISPNSATQLTNLTVTPSPNTANIQTAFGFDTEVEEFPNIT